MDIGVSSSCFYPQKTEISLKNVGELGVKNTEIFMNSFSELKGPVLTELKNIKDFYNISVRSIHPFTSFTEPNLLFSQYKRKREDTIDFYKYYFEAASQLGAEILVIHGGMPQYSVCGEEYFETYAKLCESGKQFNVFPAHENVNKYYGSDLNFMIQLQKYIGDDFKLVLDIKQSRRSGTNEFDYINKFKGKIAQIHLSDCDLYHDCLPPGKGNYDFQKLFCELKSSGYNKTAVIELYRKSFNNMSQIAQAVNFLNKEQHGDEIK